jgi:ABC-2 type transport system permease protein
VLNEAEKIWKRRSTRAFLLLAVLVPAVSAALLALLKSRSVVFGSLGGSLPIMMLGLFTFTLLPLFLFTAAADVFAGERAERTLKLVLVRPITRTKVFASKLLAIAGATAVLLAALWLASIASAALVPSGAVPGGLLDSLIAYTAALLPLLAIGLLAAFVAIVAGSGSGALAAMVLLYAAAKLAAFFFPAVGVWSLFSYTDWHLLWVGGGASATVLLRTFVLLLSYCIMAYTAGWLSFVHRDV